MTLQQVKWIGFVSMWTVTGWPTAKCDIGWLLEVSQVWVKVS